MSGQSVTFTAAVSSSAATGTVQFLDGTTVLEIVTLTARQASFSTSALSAGTHSLTALYSGDTTYDSSTSTVLSQTVVAGTRYRHNATILSNGQVLIAGALHAQRRTRAAI